MKYGDPLTRRRPAPQKAPKECVVDGCGKKPFGFGFCIAHYTRNRRHGSPTGGGAGKGEPMRWLKDHVNYSGDDCLDWPYAKGRGYGLITHKGKFMSAPKLMCEMAHGPAPSDRHQCAHSCGNGHKGCINPHHLRWATPRENHADKHKHKTMPLGESHSRSRLKEPEVRRIRSLKGEAVGADLARKYGVDPGTIYAIWNGRNWKHLD